MNGYSHPSAGFYPNYPNQAGPGTTTAIASTNNHGYRYVLCATLELLVERYLPPVGKFYDQKDLDRHFGRDFFVDHQKAVSTSTALWSGTTNTMSSSFLSSNHQTFSGTARFDPLEKTSLSLSSWESSGILPAGRIFPQYLHPRVAAFYHDEPTSRPLRYRAQRPFNHDPQGHILTVDAVWFRAMTERFAKKEEDNRKLQLRVSSVEQDLLQRPGI
ncbi:hypothetical protein IQ07DRAFT_644809 [Pyrenochaeta sp. DS3sAY3a]|nr:hypothetical protein IQ07DRAFT_644809 [Pyrenochaeta sp. DS3sAY3a]